MQVFNPAGIILEFAEVPLSERMVYVAFDSDQATNPNVQKAAVRLYNEFPRHGAVPKVLCLPAGENGAKQGLDDFLVSGRSREDLFALPSLDVDTLSQVEQKETHGQYRMTPQGSYGTASMVKTLKMCP